MRKLLLISVIPLLFIGCNGSTQVKLETHDLLPNLRIVKTKDVYDANKKQYHIFVTVKEVGKRVDGIQLNAGFYNADGIKTNEIIGTPQPNDSLSFEITSPCNDEYRLPYMVVLTPNQKNMAFKSPDHISPLTN